jgi:predicted Zn-dependent protease
VQDSTVRQQLVQAHAALTQGDAEAASRLLAPLLRQSPALPAAIHLAGLVARSQGDLSKAEDLMRRSLQLDGVVGQQRAEYANNLGNLLRGAGFVVAAEAAYREAVAAFDLPQARIGLARVFLESDRADDAIAVLARIPPARATAQVYVLLSQALAAGGEPARGLEVLARAGEALQPHPALQLARAERLGELGRFAEAETVLAPLLDGAESANAHLALAALQLAARDWPRAVAVLESGLARHAHHTALLARHAALLWMTGHGAHFAQRLHAALAASPDDAALRLALASALANAGFADEGEAVLREGLQRRPHDATLNALLALRCAETDRPQEARAAIAQALAVAPELPLVRENAAIVALVDADADAALLHTAWLVAGRPLGQFAWALRVLALRLAGNAAWQALSDPSRVCRVAPLAAPEGYATIGDFNRVLAERLSERHNLVAHPLVNSVRGGTQVEIHPAAESDPVIQAFLRAIQAPIADYIAQMPQDTAHPLWQRKRAGFRLSGCWTVRLRGSAGRHVSHIHPEGWISSAYYVDVPPEIPASATREGWLSFGRPPYPVPGLEALGHVRPEAGQLALFPSYQWHGVEAFPGEGERLTIAFDVIPA